MRGLRTAHAALAIHPMTDPSAAPPRRAVWLRALRWLLVEKWQHDEDVAVNKIGLSEGETIFYDDTPEAPAEPTGQDLVNAMHGHMEAIQELRTQLYARDIKIEFSAQTEVANNPWIYARYTKQMAPKAP